MQLFRSKRTVKLEEQVKALPKLQAQIASLRSLVNQNNIALGAQFINDSIARYPDWGIADITNKYTTSDEIFSIVNKIAETSALLPFSSYIKKSDKQAAKYLTLTNRQFYTTKGIFDIRMMQTKALEDAPENDPLNMLLNEPNEYMSKNEFTLAAYIYYLLNGEAFIWKERVLDGARQGKVKYMHIWAPENVVVHVTTKYPIKITAYSFIVNGQIVIDRAPPENVIHWKRFKPCTNTFNGDDLRGMSPLKTLANTIRRGEESDIRSLSQIKNGGVPGIVYDESVGANELSQETFDLQREAFYKFITSDQNTEAPFFVGNKKGYLALGLKMADMDLIALGKVDFKRKCNVYKISDIVFNSDSAATESNVQEMIKQMYTNACLPMIYSLRDKLNSGLANEFDRYLDCDISNVTELQDDMLQLAQVLSNLPVSPTGNEIRELFKYERLEDPLLDKPLVKQGYIFIEDVGSDIVPLNSLQP